MTPEQAKDMMEQVPEWKLSEDVKSISRLFGFKDFAKALAFTNEIGKIAEEDWHHPDIRLSWGKVEVKLTTHSIRGLSENDFIVAAKIDLLPK
jgi:4a-hydroxytetrahydrobiopterin dehydratase